MSIQKTTSVGNKLDVTYHLKNVAPSKTHSKSDVYKEPPIEDIISISHEAKALLEEEKEKYIGINNYSQEELDAMLEQLKGSTDDSNSSSKIQLQCFQIAMRIISGDNIPSKDWAFLAEHEPGMLGRAMLLRRAKENPKDHKSVLEDEKVDGSTDSPGPVSFRKSESTPVESVSSDKVEVVDNFEVLL